MNYEQMSDFEINKTVADALLIAWHCRPSNSPSGSWEYSENYERYGKGGKAINLPDYCNNPADAWPVIELMLSKGILLLGDQGAQLERQSGDVDHVSGQNPLRAAMIVFLMMQEANA